MTFMLWLFLTHFSVHCFYSIVTFWDVFEKRKMVCGSQYSNIQSQYSNWFLFLSNFDLCMQNNGHFDTNSGGHTSGEKCNFKHLDMKVGRRILQKICWHYLANFCKLLISCFTEYWEHNFVSSPRNWSFLLLSCAG